MRWGPAGDMCGTSFTVCRSLLAEPADVVAAARAALTAPPTEDVPCPFRSCEEHDEELKAVLDTYTLNEIHREDQKMSERQDGKRRPGYPEAAVASGDGTAENPFVLDLAGGPVTTFGDCQDEPGETTTGPVEAGAQHIHTALDVQPGTVTLCVEDGARWWHTPVDDRLWDGASKSLRESFRGFARRPSGDATLPVTVVTREDVGPFPGE